MTFIPPEVLPVVTTAKLQIVTDSAWLLSESQSADIGNDELHGAVFLENLVKKFPTFYGTRRFSTVFTRNLAFSLS